MAIFQKFLVALGRTGADAELVRYAGMIAGLCRGAEILFVHVLADHRAEQTPVEEVQRALERQVSFAGPHRIHVLKGEKTDQILAFALAEKTDVIFVGHGKGHSGRRSLARRLAMKAPCSVWMAPQGAPAALKRILAPVDFSANSADSLSLAARMAKAAGAECLALHVYFNDAAVSYEEYGEVLLKDQDKATENFLARTELHGASVTPLVEESANVSHAIGRVAAEKQADLIVMASRGRTPSSAILLGSETEHTLIESRIPVLTVKHFGSRLGVLQALLDERFRHKSDARFG